MKENKYDDNIFFQKYSQMSRSQKGGWCGRMGDFEKDAT